MEGKRSTYEYGAHYGQWPVSIAEMASIIMREQYEAAHDAKVAQQVKNKVAPCEQ